MIRYVSSAVCVIAMLTVIKINNSAVCFPSLAEVSKTPDAAKKAADKYFRDLEEMFVFSTRKDGARVVAAYDKSVADLAAYRSLI
jgi:hypothetical protein